MQPEGLLAFSGLWRRLLGDLEELDVEVEVLAGHLVVHVKRDVAVLDLGHGGGEGVAGGVCQHDLLTGGEALGAGQHAHGNGLDEVLALLAVSLGGRDVDVDDLADLHVLHGRVEAADHLAGHAGELQRLVAVTGGVELGAVVERAHVVDLDLLALVAHESLQTVGSIG